jgi:V8-like Glu-specific endopeptidase
VTRVEGGTMIMNQYDKFKPEGFSGAPVISADNKVIGTMLAAAEGNMRQGATLRNIKERIADR